MGTSKVDRELVVSPVGNSTLQEVTLFQKGEMLMWVCFFYLIRKIFLS